VSEVYPPQDRRPIFIKDLLILLDGQDFQQKIRTVQIKETFVNVLSSNDITAAANNGIYLFNCSVV
jgi:hypothetical protein